jgi:hypothetical protein
MIVSAPDLAILQFALDNGQQIRVDRGGLGRLDDGYSSTLEDGTPIFSFSHAPLHEICRLKKRHVFRLEFSEGGSICRLIDAYVRYFQRGPNTKRTATGHLVGQVDSNFDGRILVGSNILDHAHPVGRRRVPIISGEQVSHGIGPASLPNKADRRGARDTAVCVFVLAVPHVCARNADISGEMEFMPHVPGVAVHHDDKRLCPRLSPPLTASIRSNPGEKNVGEHRHSAQESYRQLALLTHDVLHGLNERSGLLLGYVMPDTTQHAPLKLAGKKGALARHG